MAHDIRGRSSLSRPDTSEMIFIFTRSQPATIPILAMLLPHGEDLILHSVAVIGDQWICLTPQLVPAPNKIEFIPDTHLERRGTNGGSTWIAFRHGDEVPEALRRDPGHHIRMRDGFRRLVATGHLMVEARDLIAKSASGRLSLRAKADPFFADG